MVNILNLDVKKPEGNRSGQERNKGVLLQLVVEDRGVRFSLGTHSKSLLGILNGNVKARPGGSNAHRSDTKTSRQQSFGDSEKSLLQFLNLSIEFSRGINICIPIHHIFSGNSNLAESKSSIINTILTHFVAHIGDLYSFGFLHILIADSDKECSDSFVFVLNDSLGKHKGVVAVLVAISDPVFLGKHSW